MAMLKSLAATMAAIAAATVAPSIASAQIKVGITVSASGPGAALGQPQMRTVSSGCPFTDTETLRMLPSARGGVG